MRHVGSNIFPQQDQLRHFHPASTGLALGQQGSGSEELSKTSRAYVATFGFPGEGANQIDDYTQDNEDEDMSASSRSYG